MASSSEPVFGLGFEGTAIQYEDGRAVSYAELKELSDDEVLQILSQKHKLSERHCELIRSLM